MRVALPIAWSVVLCWTVAGCLIKLPQVDAIGEERKGDAAPSQGDGSWVAPPWSHDLGEGYPDWAWWAADGQDAHSGGFDLGRPDLSPPDGEAMPEQWLWECSRPMTDFGDTIHELSFVEQNHAEGPADNVFVYSTFCGFEESKTALDSTYLVGIDVPASLGVEVKCSHNCYLYLLKNGCVYANIQDCWYNGTESVQLLLDVMPGLYVLAVEFERSTDNPEEPPPEKSFDIHVAVNRTFGQEPCLSETTTLWSQLDADRADGASLEVSGALGWERRDDFLLQCPAGGPSPEKLGGMPDTAHTLLADFGGSEPRTFSVELAFPGSPPEVASGAALAVSTLPCGKTSSVIDCTWGSQGTHKLEGITAFPGETLYALIDLSSELAFDLVEPVEYSLKFSTD